MEKLSLWQQIIISSGINALVMALQVPSLKEKVKPWALQAYRAIKMAYIDDPDFQ